DGEAERGAAGGGDALLSSGSFGRGRRAPARDAREHREDSPEPRTRGPARGMERARVMMDCATFERWLDEGRPEPEAGTARVHTRDCPRCARLLVIDRALDQALRAAPTRAPLAFTDRVMARIGPRSMPMLGPAMPWWIRAASEPATVLALIAAA